MGVKNRSAVYVKFVAYLVVIVLINLAGITLFFRADLTANKAYSLSEASRRVVSTLSEPLTIDVFFTKNLPAPHNSTERYLRDLLEEYAIYANRYFNYRFYDVSPEEGDVGESATENQELARSYGIHPIQIQVIEKDEVKFQKAYMGLVLIHGDIIERIPTITSTDGLEYELTTAIQKLNNKVSALLRLPEKIKVKLFLSSSLKVVAPYMRLNQLPEIPARLEKAVEEANDRHYGKLEFEYLDPSQDQNLGPELDKYNILKVKWPALSAEIQPGEGAIGLVMAYGNKVAEIPLIHVLRLPLIGKHYELVDMDKMGEIINEGVESLIEINEDLGYLTSHGTADLSGSSPMDPMRPDQGESLMNFQALASENYTIKHVDLKNERIPDSLDCLVIAGPTESFTDYELFQIDQFLMRGKSLALLVDAFKEEVLPQQSRMPQGPAYVPLSTGLEKLLEHYGISIEKAYVMDENCYRHNVPTQFGGGERPLYFVPLIKNEFINSDLGFMRNIKGLVAMKMSPVELDTERIKENGLKALQVFSSSEKSWEMKGRIDLNPLFIRPPRSGEEERSFPLAYVLEGEFPSYFAGKPIPEKKGEDEAAKGDEEKAEEGNSKKPDVDLSKFEGEGEFLSHGKEGKIFVMASSHMLKDNMLDERGRTPNAMFVMNVLDFLNNREDIAQMRSKEQRFNPLEETGVGAKTFVKFLNIAGMPVMMVLFGIVVWFRRVSRKKRIQMIFQK